MAKVIGVTSNSIGEVTEALLLLGNGEKVRRHVTSLIPYLDYVSLPNPTDSSSENSSIVPNTNLPRRVSRRSSRPVRRAAQFARRQTQNLRNDGLV